MLCGVVKTSRHQESMTFEFQGYLSMAMESRPLDNHLITFDQFHFASFVEGRQRRDNYFQESVKRSNILIFIASIFINAYISLTTSSLHMFCLRVAGFSSLWNVDVLQVWACERKYVSRLSIFLAFQGLPVCSFWNSKGASNMYVKLSPADGACLDSDQACRSACLDSRKCYHAVSYLAAKLLYERSYKDTLGPVLHRLKCLGWSVKVWINHRKVW